MTTNDPPVLLGWQIRRRDGGPIWGEYAWLDGGVGPEPDWAPLDDDNGEDPHEYVAHKVYALETVSKMLPDQGDRNE